MTGGGLIPRAVSARVLTYDGHEGHEGGQVPEDLPNAKAERSKQRSDRSEHVVQHRAAF